MSAQDHLEPNINIFEQYHYQYEYYSQIRNLLFDGLSDRPMAQLVILPSFSNEFVWQIQEDRNNNIYYSITSTGNHSIWYNQYEDKPKKLKQIISRNEITKETAVLIKELYLAAVNTVRHSNNRLGVDGTTYYFSAFDLGLKSGTIWSPSEGTKMRELVEISMQLISQTQKKSEISPDLLECLNKLKSEL